MQYTKFAIMALAAGASASAAVEERQIDPNDPALASVAGVLLTALPPSLIQLAATNQPALVSQLESEFGAGNTPAWFSALPTDVQAFITGVQESLATAAPTDVTGISTPTQAATTGAPSSAATQSTGSAAGGNSPSTTNSPAGAYPTAVIGSGLAGIAAFAGLLAL